MKRNRSRTQSKVKVPPKQVNPPAVSQNSSILTGKNEVSVRKSHLQKWRAWLGRNWSLSGVVAICALGVSILAYKESKGSGAATRAHNMLSVRPHISFGYVANDDNGAGFLLTSSGTGPAIVNVFEVLVDGKPVQTWDEFLIRLGIVLKNPKYGFSIPTPGNHHLPRTEPYVLLWVSPADKPALHKNLGRIELKLVYCSLYDECWEQTSSAAQLEPVPVPKRKPKMSFGISQGWVDSAPQVQ